MGLENILLLVVAVVVMAYLVFALIRPERF
jgi:K+-transporting ATPase KdpF subunit